MARGDNWLERSDVAANKLFRINLRAGFARLSSGGFGPR